MEQNREKNSTILIADDSEMNRAILTDMLDDEYEILEAENGEEALSLIDAHGDSISLILLDIVMPKLDGFGVLEQMRRKGQIDEIPVIMISSESAASKIEKAYELGAVDFINRPFDALIVHNRVVNTILLYAKQKKLMELVEQQIYEKERQSRMMVEVVGNIVEFRNGESGLHIFHVRAITEMLLNHINEKDLGYRFSQEDISTISTASALHDIGKISIADEILNKPGKLTDEEFEQMKAHTTVGAHMLKSVASYQNEEFVNVAYEICRWHHERYDGKGYPDGLRGDQIPISAQVVALADVYDALTSKRVYKDAFSHEKAVSMILNGECGTFSPLILECLRELDQKIALTIRRADLVKNDGMSGRNLAYGRLQNKELSLSKRSLQLMENERIRNGFLASLNEEIQFEFTMSPPSLLLSPFSAEKLGVSEVIPDPFNAPEVLRLGDEETLQHLSAMMRGTTPGNPVVQIDCLLNIGGSRRWHKVLARATWSSDEPPRYMGVIGKIMDIHNSRMHLDDLERIASTDPLTGLLNHASARKQIEARLKDRPNGKYALIIFDLDFFKSANDNRGHLFGDQLLKEMARRMRKSVRGGDIVARAGGDEFLIFLEYKAPPVAAVGRIYDTLLGDYENFSVSLSMGVALAEMIGTDYDELFHAADNALYAVKRNGRGHYRFYDDSLEDVLSTISPITPTDERTKGR